MAGGYPAKMAIKKNKYMEEWNGKREITEKDFEIRIGDVPTFLFYGILFPFFIYTGSRSEFLDGDDRRYHRLI